MVRPSPAAVKTERLLNLVICLLYTRRPLSKARIRKLVPQYQDSSPDAFDRMFERDKDELRELGIPLRTEAIVESFEDDLGYRIDEREYRLPDVAFSADELAVIGLASRAWSQASLAGPAAQALRKLQASGLERDDASVLGLEPLLHTAEPQFEAVRKAVVQQYAISFSYRSGRDRALSDRKVEPWALTNWHGRWYLTGFDQDRQAARVFRLDRFSGKASKLRKQQTYHVPAEHDPRAMITASQSGTATSAIQLRLRSGKGASLRKQAARITTGEVWDELTVEGARLDRIVPDILSLGPDAIVTAPEEARVAVRAAIQRILSTHQGSEA
ncbi:WYL domain-containing protein [Ornithinimicrobium sp. Arc0846-15]|nr:WYL domain-containing protein [Ornithinimicrobium laminariae]